MSSPSTSSPEWQSIRPWAPRLSLAVREITSVSATFILSSPFSQTSSSARDDDGSEELEDERGGGSGSGIISEALTKGLSVSVNGASWPRVLIRVDDKSDEAVIIVYSLMPGRQYDVELGLVQNGQSSNVHSQVITEGPAEEDSSPSPESETQALTPPTSPPHTPPTPILTLDDHLNHLQHSLSLLTSERDSLATSLKSARRDAQKADAALRAEIDILKKNSEKHGQAEQRARQKVLALQESVKRAHSMTAQAQEEEKQVIDSLPELQRAKEEKEAEYERIKAQVEQEEQEAEQERKRLDGMKSELASLNTKLDKVNTKRDKLETGTIPDLESQLKEIQNELSKLENQKKTKPLSSRAPPFEPGRAVIVPGGSSNTSKQPLPTPIQRPRSIKRPGRVVS